MTLSSLKRPVYYGFILTVTGEQADWEKQSVEIIGKVRVSGKVEQWAENLVTPDMVYPATDCSEKGQINILLPTRLPSSFSAPSAFFQIVEDPEGLLAVCMEKSSGNNLSAKTGNDGES